MRKLETYLTFTCFMLSVLCVPMLAQAQDPVGWWTFEKGVELEIGAVPSDTTTASAVVRSAAAPR